MGSCSTRDNTGLNTDPASPDQIRLEPPCASIDRRRACSRQLRNCRLLRESVLSNPSRPVTALVELHIDDEISDLIEGALDRPTHIRVHSHLVHCRRCRQLLYRTYETLALLAALGSLEA
jgi:hypothetical protein